MTSRLGDVKFLRSIMVQGRPDRGFQREDGTTKTDVNKILYESFVTGLCRKPLHLAQEQDAAWQRAGANAESNLDPPQNFIHAPNTEPAIDRTLRH